MADWGPMTSRTRQKTGTWTRRKIRQQRARAEAEKRAARPPQFNRQRAGRLPHEMTDD